MAQDLILLFQRIRVAVIGWLCTALTIRRGRPKAKGGGRCSRIASSVGIFVLATNLPPAHTGASLAPYPQLVGPDSALEFYDLNLSQTQCWLLLPQLAALHGVSYLSVFSDNIGGGVLFLLSNC